MAYVTEDDLLDLLKAHAQDNLYLGREQSTLRWAIGRTVGRTLRATLPTHPTGTAVRPSHAAG